MSYDSGTGIISATDPINTPDISLALGHGSHDIGTLCASPLINKNAKFKPEAIGGIEPITLSQRMDNNFGLYPAELYTSISQLTNAAKAGSFTGGWNYNRVSPYIFNSAGEIIGGRGDCARISDFRGYNRNSPSPFGTLQPVTLLLTNDTQWHLIVPASPPLQDETAITLAEMRKADYNLQSWYFGVLLYNNTHSFRATTTQNMLNSNDWQIDFGYIATAYAGTYTAVPFMCNKAMTAGGAEPSGLRIVGAGCPPVEIKLVTMGQQYQFILTCVFQDEAVNKISYTLQIVNTTEAAKSFSNVKLYLASDSNGTNSVEIASLGTISVPAKGQTVKQGTKDLVYNGMASAFYTHCRVTFTGAASSEQEWIPVDIAQLPENA